MLSFITAVMIDWIIFGYCQLHLPLFIVPSKRKAFYAIMRYNKQQYGRVYQEKLHQHVAHRRWRRFFAQCIRRF